MSKFIELTGCEGQKICFNVDNICDFYWHENDSVTIVTTRATDDNVRFVSETPAEIMAKIREVQND